MCLTTTGQNERDQNIDMHWVCIICFDSCSPPPPPQCRSVYYPHTLEENLTLFSMRNVAAAWCLEFPLFIFPSSVQTVSVRVELTELFIASRHTRLHLASSSSSPPRGDGTGQSTGQGRAGCRAPGKRRRAGESLEGDKVQGTEQRRCAEWGTMA